MKKMFACSILLAFLFLSHPAAAVAQWVQILDTVGRGPAYSLGMNGSQLYAGTWGHGVFRSTDAGNSWNPSSDGISDLQIVCFAFRDTTAFVGTMSGISYSADSGISWAPSTGLLNKPVQGLAVYDTNIYASTAMNPGGGVYVSHDDGIFWRKITTRSMDSAITAIAVNGPKLFAGSFMGSGVFLTDDNGVHWTVVNRGLTRKNIVSLGCYGTLTYAGTDSGGVFVSTNDGADWSQVNTGIEGVLWIYSFAFGGSQVFAGTSQGVFTSADTGAHWTPVSNPGTAEPAPAIQLASDGTSLYASSYGKGFWRRPISEMVTAVHAPSGRTLPAAFSLEQNYPNPFNPSTGIEYRIAKTAYATLKVYNLLGQEVVTLVNEQKQPGAYRVRWDASHLTSGVYFYTLTAGDFRQTRRMVLVK